MSPTKQRIAIAEELGWRLEFIEGNGVDATLWISNLNLVDGFEHEIPNNCPDCLRKLGDCKILIDYLETKGWACVIIAERGKRCCTFINASTGIEHKVITLTFEAAICESFLRTCKRWVD